MDLQVAHHDDAARIDDPKNTMARRELLTVQFQVSDCRAGRPEIRVCLPKSIWQIVTIRNFQFHGVMVLTRRLCNRQ
jgi:hypothetical protein